MTEEFKEDPAKKMRKLIGSASAISRLPKKNDPPAEEKPIEIKKEATPATVEKESPLKKLTKLATKPKPASSTKGMPVSASSGSASIFGPRFWTIASVISLTINGISLLALIITGIMLLRFGLGVSNLVNMGNSLLGGLYTNFEKMDRASIQTNVSVDTTIPVKFDLQLNQQTNVVLSQDVEITNALVTMNTGGLNITRGNTTIILPQGTTLPVVLNLVVPVDTTVPVTLNVPVNIPLSQTQLHEPFTGLQDVVRPFYCLINSNAVNLNGESVCK